LFLCPSEPLEELCCVDPCIAGVASRRSSLVILREDSRDQEEDCVILRVRDIRQEVVPLMKPEANPKSKKSERE